MSHELCLGWSNNKVNKQGIPILFLCINFSWDNRLEIMNKIFCFFFLIRLVEFARNVKKNKVFRIVVEIIHEIAQCTRICNYFIM